ncbi:MAG: FAD:protein FMN transferase [Bacillota bacterium]
MLFRKHIVILVVIIAAMLIQGCASNKNNNEKMYTEAFFAMDTVFGLQIPESHIYLSAQAIDLVTSYNSLFDKHESSGEVYQINNRVNNHVYVSDGVFELITKAVEIAELTDGYFDPTIGALVDIWDWTAKEVPNDELILDTIKYIDYQGISFDAANNRITFSDSNMQIDLGGIAKGYATKKILNLFEDAGVNSALIASGGNQYALGKKPDGSYWQIGIIHPREPGAILGSVQIENMAIDTSGDYIRYFIKDDQRYHHVINPKTGYPSEGIISATVITECPVKADAISTAILAGGLEFAFGLYKKLSSFEFILVDEELRIYISEDMYESFRSADGVNVIVVPQRK